MRQNMNKIFKIVWNAARGKMMVVNEATSSVQTGKKAAVTVALVGALVSGIANAASNIDTTDGFVVESDGATIISGDLSVHSNSLWDAGYTAHSTIFLSWICA